jgi:hypothetical protein
MKKKIAKVKTLTGKETKKLSKVLDFLENDALQYYKRISGGFATADVFDYDNEYIDVELKSGVQSDCQNTVNTEQFKIVRKTMEVVG